MPTKMSMTSVSIVPTSKDVRVVALAVALGVTTRAAWAMAAAAWEWLDEAADDGVVKGASLVSLEMILDVDVKGLGEQLVAAGLVGVTEHGLVLPSELVRASRLLDGDGDDAAERRRKKDRERQQRRRKRVRRDGRTTTSTSGQQPAQPRVPRSLGKVCGDHAVMKLWGKHGGFVELKGASPPVTASVAEYDYDAVTLADALELLVLQFKKKPAQNGGYRVPRLVDLEAAAKLERERQQAADADAVRHDQGNAALLEAAAEVDDDDHERDSPLLSRDVRGRHAGCHGPTDAEPKGSPSVDTELGAAACHAPAVDAAASSSSFPLGSPHAQQNTTNKAASGSVDRDRSPAAPEAVPPWLLKERQERSRARAEGWAAVLGVTVDEIRRMFADDKEDLRRRLEAAGVDPNSRRPLRDHDTPIRPTSASSAARIAGIPLPDLGMDRLRSVADQDGDEGQNEMRDQDGDLGVDEAHDHDVDVDDDHDVQRVDKIHEPDVGLSVDADAGGHGAADRLPRPATVNAVS